MMMDLNSKQKMKTNLTYRKPESETVKAATWSLLSDLQPPMHVIAVAASLKAIAGFTRLRGEQRNAIRAHLAGF